MGIYIRLVDYNSQQAKEEAFLSGSNCYVADEEKFEKIPGSPIAYWLSDKFIQAFVSFKSVGESARIAKGLVTANNDKFVRVWSEVEFRKVGFGYANRKLADDSGKVWFPYAKGGLFRKWYGNFDSVVNWENDGYLIQNTLTDDGSRVRATNFNLDRIFKKGISWTVITSGTQSFRLCPDGYLFDAAAGICQPHKNFLTLFGFLNSIVADILLKTINPTLNLHPGYIECLPFDSNLSNEEIEQLVYACIEISITDWDSFETSWDFQKHPLI